MTPEHVMLLEALIDQNSVKSVLEAMAEIAGQKAEHLRVNWQDRMAAGAWDEVSGHLTNAACDVDCTFADPTDTYGNDGEAPEFETGGEQDD